MTARAKIVVVGSSVMDLVVHAPRPPRLNENVIGHDFGMYLGGKGANQAVAAARLGADVTFVSCIGDDVFGRQFLEAFDAEGVDRRFVVVDPAAGTGVGMPVIYPGGHNTIIVAPQANLSLAPEHVAAAAAAIRAADALLFQLEVPVPAIETAVALARAAGVRVIANPAPAVPLPPDLLAGLDWLVPNESEAEAYSGLSVADEAGARAAARALRAQGPGTVVITCGARGALWSAEQGEAWLPTFPVAAVDPTGAGDAFCAALAVALARGQAPRDAVRFASAAGALATTQVGANRSMPAAAEVERLVGDG